MKVVQCASKVANCLLQSCQTIVKCRSLQARAEPSTWLASSQKKAPFLWKMRSLAAWLPGSRLTTSRVNADLSTTRTVSNSSLASSTTPHRTPTLICGSKEKLSIWSMIWSWMTTVFLKSILTWWDSSSVVIETSSISSEPHSLGSIFRTCKSCSTRTRFWGSFSVYISISQIS